MINIFDIPLYYISFTQNNKFEEYFKQNGFNNINFFKAVNGKYFNPKKLLEDGKITTRTYNDLLTFREQHSGIPGLGAIGCTMSHHALWTKCIKENMKYITIVEDDMYFVNKIDEKDMKIISDCIEQPNGAFFGNSIKQNKIKHMFGTHFCILSNSACKQLAEHAFPIDVQTDAYVTHLADIGALNICGEPIAKQKILLNSSIQNICVKCYLPNDFIFYVAVVLGIISIIIIAIIFIRKYILCEKFKKKNNK